MMMGRSAGGGGNDSSEDDRKPAASQVDGTLKRQSSATASRRNSDSSEDASDESYTDVPRKRKAQSLAELNAIAAAVREDDIPVEERQRKMGMIYSRRKRVRQKIRVQGLEEQCSGLREENARLRQDNEQLDMVLQTSLGHVALYEQRHAQARAPSQDQSLLGQLGSASSSLQAQLSRSHVLPFQVSSSSAELLQELLRQNSPRLALDLVGRQPLEATVHQPSLTSLQHLLQASQAQPAAVGLDLLTQLLARGAASAPPPPRQPQTLLLEMLQLVEPRANPPPAPERTVASLLTERLQTMSSGEIAALIEGLKRDNPLTAEFLLEELRKRQGGL